MIAQDQLEVLKENAEECLDLQVPKEAPSAEADKLPVTRWEAELQKEVSPNVEQCLVQSHPCVTIWGRAVTACGGGPSWRPWRRKGKSRGQKQRFVGK